VKGESVEIKAVVVKNNDGSENSGEIKIITRDLFARFRHSARRSGKIIGLVLLALPIAIFVHVLLLIGVLTTLFSIGFFIWGMGDRVTFDYVEIECSQCHKKGRLTGYVSKRVHFPLPLHCPQCGSTIQALEA
jgi:hypothetical protein